MEIMKVDFSGSYEDNQTTVMENKTSPSYENLERSEYRTADSSRQLIESKTSKHLQQFISTDDILLEDFPEEESFVLREEFVLMEDEYIMWEGTLPCNQKSREESMTAFLEEEALFFPEDDSLHHLGKYVTLKNSTRPIRHY